MTAAVQFPAGSIREKVRANGDRWFWYMPSDTTRRVYFRDDAIIFGALCRRAMVADGVMPVAEHHARLAFRDSVPA